MDRNSIHTRIRTSIVPATTLTLILAAYLLQSFSPALYAPRENGLTDTIIRSNGNPIIRHKFTADPAAFVYNDKVYLYTGHDEAPARRNGYEMHDWLCFSSSDMVNWTEHEVPLRVKDFAW